MGGEVPVNGCEFYYGLFADLDEAKRVCAAARLEHNPKARARDESSSQLCLSISAGATSSEACRPCSMPTMVSKAWPSGQIVN